MNTVVTIGFSHWFRSLIFDVISLIGKYENIECKNAIDALRAISVEKSALLVYEMGGLELDLVCDQIRLIHKKSPGSLVVIFAKEESVKTVSALLRAGAAEVIFPPLSGKTVWSKINRWLGGEGESDSFICKKSYATDEIKSSMTLEANTTKILNGFTAKIDFGSPGHIRRVGAIAYSLARVMGVPESKSLELMAAAPFHDVGKINVPLAILNKNGTLNDCERRIMNGHPITGYYILHELFGSKVQMASIIALLHHERFDGSGYPFGLTGDQIPLEVRCSIVADVYDALVSDRTYKRAWTTAEALNYMAAESGVQFCPKVVSALQKIHLDFGGVQHFNDYQYSFSNDEFADNLFPLVA